MRDMTQDGLQRTYHQALGHSRCEASPHFGMILRREGMSVVYTLAIHRQETNLGASRTPRQSHLDMEPPPKLDEVGAGPERIRAMAARLLAARPQDLVRVRALSGPPSSMEIVLERPDMPPFRFHVHASSDDATEFDIIRAVDDTGWTCC